MRTSCATELAHLLHDPRAVHLHTALTQPQLVRDDLVGMAADDLIEHIALAGCQRHQALANGIDPAERRPVLVVTVDRAANIVDELRVGKGFLQEVECPPAHGFDGRGDLAPAGHENDGDGDSAGP